MNGKGTDRRTFLKDLAVAGGALAVGGGIGATARPLAAAAQSGQANAGPVTSANPWAKQVGLELFTVRDAMRDPKSYVATLEKLAAIGYKEIEPAGGYANMQPKEFRAMLDRLGMKMFSTHSGATEGPDLEKQLEGFQIMGIQYTEISAPRPASAGRGRGPGGARGAARGGRGRGPGGFQMRQQTSDEVKRTADQLNKHGEIAKKFGMKILVHNHTMEFAPLSDNSKMRPYDIILANTDPSLVVMQLDIGWAEVAGQNALEMFKKTPGRFELWHVKDAMNIKYMTPNMNEAERMSAAALVPVGLGEIDYKAIFAQAKLAGMKHYCIEQDNAAAWGDSVAAARVSYNNLLRILG